MRTAPQSRPKGKGKLAVDQSFFVEVIEQDGDVAMPELAAALLDVAGVHAQPWVHNPKKALVATERRRVCVGRLREDWFRHPIPAVSVRPEHIVFIDETSIKTNLAHQRA